MMDEKYRGGRGTQHHDAGNNGYPLRAGPSVGEDLLHNRNFFRGFLRLKLRRHVPLHDGRQVNELMPLGGFYDPMIPRQSLQGDNGKYHARQGHQSQAKCQASKANQGAKKRRQSNSPEGQTNGANM
jgi:hypothetical protein